MATKWTEDEDRYLLKNSKQELELLAKVLNRSTGAVKARLYKVQREPKENLYQEVEVGWFLERASRALPDAKPRLPNTAVSTAKLATWTGNRRGGNAYRHTKTGFRTDLGFVCRSGWEANIARIFKSYGIGFEYEPAIFTFPIKRGTTKYTPDFWLPGTDEWIEVKGRFDNESRIKLKRFKKYYPDQWEGLTMIIDNSKKARDICMDLEVPNVLFYQEIKKAFRTRIKNWEGK
jgi:hypothetical protein